MRPWGRPLVRGAGGRFEGPALAKGGDAGLRRNGRRLRGRSGVSLDARVHDEDRPSLRRRLPHRRPEGADPRSGTSGALAVAVSGTSVAYIRRRPSRATGHPLASANLPVEVRDAQSGTLLASVVPKGTPLALALAPDVLALLEKTKAGMHVSWYDAATGKLSGSVAVPSATGPS